MNFYVATLFPEQVTSYLNTSITGRGIAKGAITTSSSLIDVVWSGYDGYKNGGAWGAIQAAGWSGFLNYGLPKVLEKVPWHADITPRFGQKPTYKSADVVRMEIETRRATKDISDYTVKKNRINELEFKPETPGSTKMVLKRPNGKIVTDAELKVMRKAVVQAAAKINAARAGIDARFILSDDGLPRGESETGRYSLVVGNPPYYSDYRIADVFMETAYRALRPGGRCLMVVKTATGLLALQEKYFRTAEVIKRRGYCVLRSVRS